MSIHWPMNAMMNAHVSETVARKTSEEPAAVQSEIRDLRERMDHLTMISMALWSLLKEHTDLTEEDLEARVEKIDLADGHLDGRVRVAIQNCSQCNRVVSKRHSRCLYCGAEVENLHGPFSKLL